MRTLRVISVLSGLALAATGLGLAAPAAGAHTGEQVIGICDHRACLLVLDPATDSDGDGVTDVDEIALGTDPRDPHSRPLSQQILDDLVNRRLPSFERHLTEVVVLPQTGPDGRSLATGLGRYGMPTVGGSAGIYADLRAAFDGLQTNGFDPTLGLRTQSRTSKGGPGTGLLGFDDQVALGTGNKGGGGIYGPTNYGPNGTKDVTQGKDDGRTSYSKDGVEHSYTVPYTDGSRDVVTSTTATAKGDTTSTTVFTSYDSDGVKSAFTQVSTKTTTTDDGGMLVSATVETTTYNADGDVNGSVKVHVEVITEGTTTTTTVEVTTTDADGKPKTVRTTNVKNCAKQPCTSTDSTDSFTDPDYVQFVLTQQDADKALTRLNQTRRPGPDTGSIDPAAAPRHASGLNPLIALISPDGITVLGVGATLTFNRVLPEYGPDLDTFSAISGVPIPKPNNS